ncbi:MAG: DUF1707 domain-containing protein [Solirubrobacteraceae bacterium]|jgi:hypothetical protein
MAEPPDLRAADSDRDRVAADLREHFAAGRLGQEELGERLELVYASRTLAELERVGADLPDPRPLPVPAGSRELARRRIYQDAGAVVILDLGCVAVWAATGSGGSFWPEYVILFSVLRLARDAWRLLGPAPERARHAHGHGQRRARHGSRRLD